MARPESVNQWSGENRHPTPNIQPKRMRPREEDRPRPLVASWRPNCAEEPFPIGSCRRRRLDVNDQLPNLFGPALIWRILNRVPVSTLGMKTWKASARVAASALMVIAGMGVGSIAIPTASADDGAGPDAVACPLTICVVIKPESFIADVAATGVVPKYTLTTLTVAIGGLDLEIVGEPFTVPFAQVNGLPPPPCDEPWTVCSSFNPAQTVHYDITSAAVETLLKAGELWNGRLQVYYQGTMVVDLPTVTFEASRVTEFTSAGQPVAFMVDEH